MNINLLTRNQIPIAVVTPGPDAPEINHVQDALDLMADARYLYDTGYLLIHKPCLNEAFFDLRTGLAGEILQKFTNYGAHVAILGDFSGYNSKSLRDFIRESNEVGRFLFLCDEDKALEGLCRQGKSAN